jgi:hypothetical protein
LDFIDKNCGFFDFRKLRAIPRKKILNPLIIPNQKQLKFIYEFVITYKLTFLVSCLLTVYHSTQTQTMHSRHPSNGSLNSHSETRSRNCSGPQDLGDNEIYESMLKLATEEDLIDTPFTKSIQGEILSFVQNRMELQEAYDDQRSEHSELLDECDYLLKKNNLGSLKDDFDQYQNLPKPQIIRTVFQNAGLKLAKFSTGEYDMLKKECESMEQLLEECRDIEKGLTSQVESSTEKIEELLKEIHSKNDYIRQMEDTNKEISMELDGKKSQFITVEMKTLELETKLYESNLRNKKEVSNMRQKNTKTVSELKANEVESTSR